MQSLVVLLLFVGIVMVMHGMYEERLAVAERTAKVEYRFVPRTLYEEQMESTSVSGKFKNMFQQESPWFDRRYKPGAAAGEPAGAAGP